MASDPNKKKLDIVLARGGWIVGDFEGHYVAEHQTSPLPGVRALDLRLVGGVLRNTKRAAAPPRTDDPMPMLQGKMPVLVELGNDAETGEPRVHHVTLRDVALFRWREEPLYDDVGVAKGTIRGTLYGRVFPPEGKGCLPWLLWLLTLLLLLLVLLWLLLAGRCDAVPAARDARETLDTYAGEWTRWVPGRRGDLVTPHGAGTGLDSGIGGGVGSGVGSGVGTGVGVGGGTGSGTGTGAGDGTGTGTGTGAGAGDGTGTGTGTGAGAGDGTGTGAGAGAGASAGAGAGAEAGAGAGDGASDGAGDGTGKASSGASGQARMSMAEAEKQPSRFFHRCGTQLTLEGELLFDLNSHALGPEAQDTLVRLADLMRAHKSDDVVVQFVGHTDPRGTERLNDQLSLSRAKRVRDFLVAQGAVELRNTRVEGRGKREPLHPIAAPEEQQLLNRRVDVSVACREGASSLLPAHLRGASTVTGAPPPAPSSAGAPSTPPAAPTEVQPSAKRPVRGSKVVRPPAQRRGSPR